MRCCVVTKDDEYLLICTSNNDNENGNDIKRGLVTCFDIKKRIHNNTLTFDG